MLIKSLTVGLRFLRALPAVKTKKEMVSSIKEKKDDDYRFGLKDLRCSICHSRPHPGLTKQLSPAARSKGIIQCGIHGPVEAEVRISVDGYLDQKRAA
jgi:hypothetical protein